MFPNDFVIFIVFDVLFIIPRQSMFSGDIIVRKRKSLVFKTFFQITFDTFY